MLTEKQLRALRACVYPDSVLATMFWHDARARWPGPRRTLGSLITRGLVSYSHQDGWKATDHGRSFIEDLEAGR